MLTFDEQTEILRLAKNLMVAGVKRNAAKESLQRTGTPVYKTDEWVKTAENKLKDYLKEVG